MEFNDENEVIKLTSAYEVQSLAIVVYDLAKKSPDNKYNSGNGGCFNNSGECTDGSKGCIVGQAARKLGFTLMNRADIVMLANEFCDMPTYRFLLDTQFKQDAYQTWEESMKYGMLNSGWMPPKS